MKKIPSNIFFRVILFGLFTVPIISYSQNPVLTKAASSPVQLKLNKRFYNADDAISASLKFKAALPVPNAYVIFVSPSTGDAEGLKLKQISPLEYTTEGTLKILIGLNKDKNDGLLTVKEGEVITAYYYNTSQKNKNPQAKPSPDMPDLVCEFAFIRDPKINKEGLMINKNYALNSNESVNNAATILVEGQLPIQVAKNQIIFYADKDQEWKEFLQYSNCKLLGQASTAGAKLNNNVKAVAKQTTGNKAYLVELPFKDINLNDFAQMRQFLGLKQKIFSSDEEAMKMVQFCSMANLDGFSVSLNPRMQYHSNEEKNTVNYFINPPGSLESIPASFTDRFTNIQKVWNYMAIWDRDASRVRVGIVDYGFEPNLDYRNSTSMVQCEASSTGLRCGAGTALGAPTVGASLFGRRVWHGNAVEGRSSGVLNNNFGTAGTGGQVAIPMAIKMTGADAYAFNIGGAIRAAVDNGAEVINISGGFPCRVLTSLGDFNYCDPGTRGAICAALFPIVQSGVIIACSALAWIPFATETCLAVATSAYISACVAQFALGNPGEIISSGVQYAKDRGVPVVVSAGNFIRPEHLSVPELRPFVNLDERRMTVEDWGIVPAGLPDVICVGAANPTAPYANNQVFGNRVDVWAPEDGDYMAPDNGDLPAGPSNPTVLKRDFNGTSSAAPFITGLIANAMAVNPQLNRNTSTNIGSIVTTLRNLLSSTAWNNSALPADPTGRRRNLVNPIAFLQAASFAAGSPVPSFSASVYGNEWNLDATENTDDVTPTTIVYGTASSFRSGSIIHIPGTDGAANITDVDRYRINVMSTYRPATGERMLVKLKTPTGSRFGNLTVRGADLRLIRTDVVSGSEEEKVFEGPIIRSGGMAEDISVEGETPDQDNIYQLSIGNVIPPAPTDRLETITLTNITNELCPGLERGDREFGGGPLINVTVSLQRTADESGIDAFITYKAEETGGDRSTATGSFTQRVFNAAAGLRITAIDASTTTSQVVNFRGAGAGAEFGGDFGCNEGVVQSPPVTGSLVRSIVVVGDSGGNDIGTRESCRCDTKIKSIQFNQVVIRVATR